MKESAPLDPAFETYWKDNWGKDVADDISRKPYSAEDVKGLAKLVYGDALRLHSSLPQEGGAPDLREAVAIIKQFVDAAWIQSFENGADSDEGVDEEKYFEVRDEAKIFLSEIKPFLEAGGKKEEKPSPPSPPEAPQAESLEAVGMELILGHERALQAFIYALKSGGPEEAGKALDAARAALTAALAVSRSPATRPMKLRALVREDNVFVVLKQYKEGAWPIVERFGMEPEDSQELTFRINHFEGSDKGQDGRGA